MHATQRYSRPKRQRMLRLVSVNRNVAPPRKQISKSFWRMSVALFVLALLVAPLWGCSTPQPEVVPEVVQSLQTAPPTFARPIKPEGLTEKPSSVKP